MDFEVIGDITGTETIATGSGIRERGRLRKRYGRGRWRKRKGFAEIRLPSGEIVRAELHWYEATGIGKRERRSRRSFRATHTWQERQNVYLSVSITLATRYHSSAGRFTLRCRIRKRSAPDISGSSTSPAKIICIQPNVSSRQSYLFPPVAPSCTSPDN